MPACGGRSWPPQRTQLYSSAHRTPSSVTAQSSRPMPPPALKHAAKNARSSASAAVHGVAARWVRGGSRRARRCPRSRRRRRRPGPPGSAPTTSPGRTGAGSRIGARRWRRPSTGHWLQYVRNTTDSLVGGLRDDRQRPQHLAVVVDQVRQHLDDGAAGRTSSRPRVSVAGVTLRPQGLVLPDELPQLPVPADLAGAGIVDHDVAGPHRLQSVRVTLRRAPRSTARRDRPDPRRGSPGAPARRRR